MNHTKFRLLENAKVGDVLNCQMHGYGGWSDIQSANAPHIVINVTPAFVDVQGRTGPSERVKKACGRNYVGSSYRFTCTAKLTPATASLP